MSQVRRNLHGVVYVNDRHIVDHPRVLRMASPHPRDPSCPVIGAVILGEAQCLLAIHRCARQAEAQHEQGHRSLSERHQTSSEVFAPTSYWL